MLAEYACPTVPELRDAVVTLSGGGAAGLTVIRNCLLSERLFASVTRAVKSKLPAVVGVPVNAPLDGSSEIPAGNAPADTVQVNGAVPPVAVTDAEYAAPTVAAGKEAVWIAGGI